MYLLQIASVVVASLVVSRYEKAHPYANYRDFFYGLSLVRLTEKKEEKTKWTFLWWDYLDRMKG